ncbi:hypothetical protein ACIPCB_09405 [Pediococcus pentosaceus]|jgi:adenine-specific DNA-methyltransferase|uniref:hypothetical protein n=1 Tax=Lactobacillaceae TaxID=33958 RepID=UPI000704CF26|nr:MULTISPECIES: hypothetical protein [Lactobacillaceae]HAC5320499.1 hypothetical protein [Listeria monocytogenes]APD02839.1 hypothetical protein ASV54_15815 [Lactiplantibacillus plantarum]KRN47606.1 hypothetical protein IV86_GL000403 [Pediococcus pentosaceus]MCS8571674.1 hypothetical protein [Pediococcus pentosaceus]MCS8575208.1 hypothetical protein [Pediococcus pentosaceus]
MTDSKIKETAKSILKDFGNTYFSDKGTLKRNKVIEDLDTYTPMLMKALLANGADVKIMDSIINF